MKFNESFNLESSFPVTRKTLVFHCRALLWVFTIIFGVSANMIWDFGKETRSTRFGFTIETCIVLKSFIFLVQAFARTTISSFAWSSNWTFVKCLTIATWGKLLGVAFLGAFANFLNVIGISHSGSEVFAVFRLTRLPLVAFLRFMFFNDRPGTINEWAFLLVIFFGALSFTLCEPNLNLNGSMIGFIFMAAGCFFKGCAEVLVETFMRFEFKSMKLLEQQFLWGLTDSLCYCVLIIIESHIEERKWPPWENFFSSVMPLVTVFILGFDSLNRLLVTEYDSSLILTLLYVIIMLTNWAVKLIINFEKVFIPSRIPLLILLSLSVFAYYNEEIKRKKQQYNYLVLEREKNRKINV